MDLVDYDQAVFDAICAGFKAFATRLDVSDLAFIPISALNGDNVVQRSPNMGWYEGQSLLHHLEQVYIASDRNLIDPRIPVQWVVRPHRLDHSRLPGCYRPVGWPEGVSGPETRSPSCHRVSPPRSPRSTPRPAFDGPVEEAFAPMSVVVRLSEDLDVSRGDMICRANNHPSMGQDIDAMVCWMTDKPMRQGDFLALEAHHPGGVRAVVKDVHYRLDVNTLHRDEEADSLALNEVGRVSLRVTQPLFYDSYRRNRTTGSFILASEETNVTVGAGMILGPD